MSVPIEVPENFKTVIVDFTKDLSTTYPECDVFLKKWYNSETKDEDYTALFRYCMKVYPERFFDILYQNEDIFDEDKDANTAFLPGLDFKILFKTEGVTDTIRKSIWKYLQLILFTIVGTMKDKANFGDTMNLFAGIDEKDLQSKLNETMESITDFFSKMGENMKKTGDEADKSADKDNAHDDKDDDDDDQKFHFNFDKMDGMPNIKEIHENLKGMFDGKIGSLAKELAEEISGDMAGLLGIDMEGAASSEEILKKLMKNPQKIMELVKIVGNKLNSKMKSGDISQDELMKEASELMEKMKQMGGDDKFNEILKNLTKGMGKNVRVDTNAMQNKMKQSQLRERMKARLQQRKLQAEIQQKTQASANLIPTDAPNTFIYKAGDEQEKSYIIDAKRQAELDNELIAMFDDIKEPAAGNKGEKSKKKKKGKK
jgi:hypothetical protein